MTRCLGGNWENQHSSTPEKVWPELDQSDGRQKDVGRGSRKVIYCILSVSFIWNWHRFPAPVRLNGRSGRMTPYNFRRCSIPSLTHAACASILNSQLLKENTPSRVVRGERSRQRRRIPISDASKWFPDSQHPTSGCFPFVPYFFCFFKGEEMTFLGQHFYYVIHHAVPRGDGSRSFLRDSLSSEV